MKLIEFIRLILRHLTLLILVPILLASLVILLTLKPHFEYSSQTLLYTGLASGSSIEMDKTFNYQATNTAFDNLINIILSRETQEEVAIRLLAQHLLLPKANPKYISSANFDEFKLKIPKELYKYVDRGNTSKDDVTAMNNAKGSLFPPEINRINYEKTVQNLTALKNSSNTNYVYELLNYEDPHYSIAAIATVKAMRISNSDLIKLTYQVDDPGICQQTLAIYNEVCIENYRNIKENRSDDVVKYFEAELAKANEKLKKGEDKLLDFNKSYNIINYYEQSKAVANVKEDMEVDYNKKRAELAGIEASTKRLEKKLSIQEVIQSKSNSILEKKKQLGELNYKIAMTQAEIESNNSEKSIAKMAELKKQSENLTNEISQSINELYSYQNTVDGLPVSKVLPDWLANTVESENIKAKLKVMDVDNKNFQKQYEIYAPAGANITRIEREISVSEQEFLEILHGLNLAKLKLQDNTLSSNLKAIDPPYYPLSPLPTKRKVLIIAAAFLGFILTLGILILMEYFDDTLRNAKKAAEILKMPSLGMLPKILLNPNTSNLPFIQNRLIEIITQNTKQFLSKQNAENAEKTIIVFSTQKMEGKTVLAGNIAKELKKEGKKILFLNYSIQQQHNEKQSKFSFLPKILGYPDPRIDFDNSFLSDVRSYLEPAEYCNYTINEQFYKAKNYKDLLEQNNIKLDFIPDYVIIELPPIIYNNYPTELLTHSDIDILVCRSNRLWSEADQSALNSLLPLSGSKTNFIINGVELKEVESLLGDLPKKRSEFRKKIKSLFQFQFFTKNQI
jgi:succinoglycan biosynthesis transport protein ExoP